MVLGWRRQPRLPSVDWRAIAILAHVLAAFWFVAGYVGTNALTEIARRAATHDSRVAALALSDQFDRWLYQRGGMAVLLTGVLSWWAFGYALDHSVDPRLDRAHRGDRTADRLLLAWLWSADQRRYRGR